MPLDPQFLEVLCCPRTRVALQHMDAEKLHNLNTAISTGTVKHADDSPVEAPLQEALITVDGKTVYKVDGGIPIMLIDQSIDARQIP